ncbi:hypothetical protein F2P56_017083 [Juglans regia]|uniref:DUF674 domain-containing protein n=2 Tax=Juglans regia TaxID=51240 RepID=A0A833XKH9_JUGRE|nr:uncharacterized protein LOC109015110 [Juglans regia]KAF5467236.1 hypothetical protein F2P56_017083 [Juglans regia]
MEAAAKLNLKLLIDKNSKRVLFAEACKEFVDFLFNILTLPFGNVVRLLKGEGMAGCLPSLYNSIENLSSNYIKPDQHKAFLLKPKVAIPSPKVPPLLPGVVAFTKRDVSYCYGSCQNFTRATETVYEEAGSCESCLAKRSITYSSEVGYVKGAVTFMVMDDLEVKPMFTTSLISLLNDLNAKEVGAIEEKVVEFGMDEGVKLLAASLQSKTVLTDVFMSRPSEIIGLDIPMFKIKI